MYTSVLQALFVAEMRVVNTWEATQTSIRNAITPAFPRASTTQRWCQKCGAASGR